MSCEIDYVPWMIDRRFPTALQIMHTLVLAQNEGIPFVTSAEFADSLHANPTFIRRLLASLARLGLVQSQLGRNGGVRLGRPAAEITLLQIHEASAEDKQIWEARPGLPERCVVSCNFQHYFAGLADEADHAVRALLHDRTLAESYADLVALDGKSRDVREHVVADPAVGNN